MVAADLTAHGLDDHPAGQSSARHTGSVELSDAVKRRCTAGQPRQSVRLALDPQDLSERHLIHRERDTESEHTEWSRFYIYVPTEPFLPEVSLWFYHCQGHFTHARTRLEYPSDQKWSHGRLYTTRGYSHKSV